MQTEKQSTGQFYKRLLLVGIVAVLLVIGIVSLGRLSKERADEERAGRINVAATIPPIADMVRTVGGDDVAVDLILPGGENPTALPAIYKVADLSDAAVIFGAGHDLDTVGLPTGDAEKFYTLDRGITVLLEEGTTGSPYYWLSLRNAAQMVANITDKLIEIDPEGRNGYEARRDAYVEQIRVANNTTAELMKQAPQSTLIVYGYDWQYFTDDYSLRIVHYQPPLTEEDEGTSAAARSDLLAAMRDYNLSVVHSDITLSPTPLLPIMAERNFTIMSLDAFGGVEDRQTYLQLMSYNARTLFEGLSGGTAN